MDFSRFTHLSFDCYGTLIDWEAGILPALRKVLEKHRQKVTDAEILEHYGEFEADIEAGPYQTYREVLDEVVARFGARYGFTPAAGERRSLPDSVAAWPPFVDTVAALHKLQQRYKLVIISNIDDDLFAATRKLLKTDFRAVITAQQARSYKPSLNNFQKALDTLAIQPDRLLHAAQSVYHDVVPAQSLGIATVWVNRKSARPGIGAVRPAAAKPDVEVPDLETLASLAEGA